MFNDKTIKEIYYYDKKQVFDSYSDINDVKINNIDKKLDSFFENGQVKLYKQNGEYAGILYGNRNIQSNNLINTVNSTGVLTISDNIGIICYMLPIKTENLVIGDNILTTSIFTSGGYLNKNILIQQEVLNNDKETRKITIFY
jgi:hypothetical protein